MKKILATLLFFFTTSLYAAGGITHMYIAQQAIPKLTDTTLQTLLQTHRDAYLVGAYYPDSGYVKGTHYGEESHWDPFIETFTNYLLNKYPDPVLQNPKLVAFLFGIASHRVSDEIFHHQLYHVMAAQDFQGNWTNAHNNGDAGIDMLINVEKNQWFDYPKLWWVPVRDLIQIYRQMGHPDYTAQEIQWGNAVIYLSGIGERIIAVPAYPYYRWKMPWTAHHYRDYANCGLRQNIDAVVNYQEQLWSRFKNHQPYSIGHRNNSPHTPMTTEANHFSATLLTDKIVTIPQQSNDDGSVVLLSPLIHNPFRYQLAINNLLTNSTKQ